MQKFELILSSLPAGISRLLVAAVLALCCAAAGAQGSAGGTRIQLVDRIVAVVNLEVITQFELNDRLTRVTLELQQRNTPLPDRDVLERQVLERMITERVQLQRADESGVRVDEQQLDKTVERVAESNNLTLAQFRAALERDSIPMEKFRAELRNEMLIARLREREVDNRISISENEVELYLAGEQQNKEDVSEYDLAHIIIRVPEQAIPEQTESLRVRAEDVVKRARGGADFSQLSAELSDAPEAMKGGDLGWRSRDRLPDLYLTTLTGMRPGDISKVLRSPAGFHILKLVNMRGAGAPLMVEQTHARHILLRVGELLSESEAKRKLDNLRERIVNGVDFAELAKLNSDDGSAGNGGDLGWLYPGDTVPEFERAMMELKIGETSAPVKSPFGMHLIQVLERRLGDRSSERKRVEARRILRLKKSDEAYQEWLRQLRDRAYVELRLEDR